jgi:hypothetical protein
MVKFREVPMSALTAALALGLLLPQDPAYSGPQKGERLPGFKVLHMNGPEKGREVDFVVEGKGAPILIVFVHEVTRPAGQVMRRLDEHAAKRGLRSVIVLLPDDMNQSERYAPILQGIMKYKSALGVSVDGKEGPGSYGLNREMTLTVLLAKDDKVRANWAIRSPTDVDAPPILKAIDELLGVQEVPTRMSDEPRQDLEARVAALEREIRELRAAIERLTRQSAGPARPAPQGAPPSDPALNGLFRRLIRPDNPNEEVDRVIGEIEAHVGDKADLRKQTVEGVALISDLKYGTEYARKRAGEMAEKLK